MVGDDPASHFVADHHDVGRGGANGTNEDVDSAGHGGNCVVVRRRPRCVIPGLGAIKLAGEPQGKAVDEYRLTLLSRGEKCGDIDRLGCPPTCGTPCPMCGDTSGPFRIGHRVAVRACGMSSLGSRVEGDGRRDVVHVRLREQSALCLARLPGSRATENQCATRGFWPFHPGRLVHGARGDLDDGEVLDRACPPVAQHAV
ncbi:unannotated protein [freshwater metagenome]|uniref:Unannotated protein n=1 Tax=freshwater metagenome TaxID=449393 RepID=A0A6J7C5W2_9ZZZZ